MTPINDFDRRFYKIQKRLTFHNPIFVIEHDYRSFFVVFASAMSKIILRLELWLK